MRTKQEIGLAINLLDKYGGEHKRSQMGVLHDRMTESQVFDSYVSNYSGDNRNEALYFAVRDAAQYVAGKLTLEELIPDMPDGALEELMRQKEEAEAEEVSKDTSGEVLNRLALLEIELNNIRKEISGNKSGSRQCTIYARLVTADEAAGEIGCCERTFNRWLNRGLFTGYSRKGVVYYDMNELENLPLIQKFKKQEP